ncbi:unnamed protein product [Discosporangium mesarthrocarpum]
MMEDQTFQRLFRMGFPSFNFIYGLLGPNLNLDVEMANLRNRVVAGEWALALTLRWLNGGTYFEMMDDPIIAKSKANSVLQRTLEAIYSCPDLGIVWPDDGRLDHVAAGFRDRSRQGIMDRCVGAVDGLFIRTHKLPVKEHPVLLTTQEGIRAQPSGNLRCTLHLHSGVHVLSREHQQ